MRSGAMLINASRGNVVDLDALAEALNGNHIGGAAIDVSVEPWSNNDEFQRRFAALISAFSRRILAVPHKKCRKILVSRWLKAHAL